MEKEEVKENNEEKKEEEEKKKMEEEEAEKKEEKKKTCRAWKTSFLDQEFIFLCFSVLCERYKAPLQQ